MTLEMTIDEAEMYETNGYGGFVAVHVHDVSEDEGRAIAWSDVTDHPHAFAVVRVLTDTPEELRWIDEIGRELFLKPLTLAGYNAVCKYFGLPPERSIAAVHAAVLTSLSAGH